MKRIYYIAFLMLILLSSCRTITKVIEVPIIKTEYIVKEKTDSILIHDSIDRVIKNDSVIIDRWHTQYKYIHRVDTIMKTDTITQTVTVPETVVEYRVSKVQKFFIWIGVITLILIILYITLFILKKIYLK